MVKKMLNKGQIIEVTMLDDQKAIYQNDTVYVNNAFKNEVLKLKITNKSRNAYDGKIIKVIKADKMRSRLVCNVYEECGGCNLLHVDYPSQLMIKQKMIQKQTKLKVNPVVKNDHDLHYRNKMILGFKKIKGKVVAGLYAEDSHQVCPYQYCLLHDKQCDDIVQTIARLIADFKIELYNEDNRTGLLRHVLIRKAAVTNEIMVVIVISKSNFPSRNNFIKALLLKHPEITTIIQNINSRSTSIVLGEEERVLYGKGYIVDYLLGNKYQISSKSFYQINHDQCEKLYSKAIELLKLNKNDVVLDTYCGIGTIGISLAPYVKKVIGVEINSKAVMDAKNNARINNINNITFIKDDASDYMYKLYQNMEKIDAIVMDPPRSGSNEKFIRSACKIDPKRIVYISCDPSTQIRDIKMFNKYGYYCDQLYPFDMFSHTTHIETVCLLSRKAPV